MRYSSGHSTASSFWLSSSTIEPRSRPLTLAETSIFRTRLMCRMSFGVGMSATDATSVRRTWPPYGESSIRFWTLVRLCRVSSVPMTRMS